MRNSFVKLIVSNAKLSGMTCPAELDRFEVADKLHSAAIHLLRHAAKPDAQSGQGPARLSALSVLVFGGPKTLGELAAAERVKAPTMSRIAAGLKRAGLARIQKDGKDARRIQISATAKGERVLQEARQRRIRALAEALAVLGPGELTALQGAAEIIERVVRERVIRAK